MTRDDWRTIRYAMKSRAQLLSHRGRVSRCGSPLTTRPGDLADRGLFEIEPAPILADVQCYRRGKRAEVHGLQTCGSPWECPLCAEKIGAENARELNTAAAVIRGRGGDVYSVTLTLRHSAMMNLAPLLKALTGAWRKVQAGDPWQRRLARHAILGHVRAIEITHGQHGFHPHLHIGLYTTRKLTKAELTDFEAWLSERWRRILIRQNPEVNVIPSFDRGVKIRKLHKDDYLAKFGLGGELAKGFVKRAEGQNRTPWQILYDLSVARIHTRDLWLWREYTRAMFRQKPLTWSHGLKAKLDLQFEVEAALVRDRESAEREDGDREPELVLTIDGREWANRVMGQPLESELMAALESGAPVERIRGWYDRRIGRAPPSPAPGPGDPEFDFAVPDWLLTLYPGTGYRAVVSNRRGQ